MSVERTVARNSAMLVLQPLVMNVLSLASTGFIARQLGSTEFGRFNLALTFVAMFAPLTNLGLRSLAVRHMAQDRGSAAEYLGRLVVLRFTLALVVAAVVILAAPFSGGNGLTTAVIAVAAATMVLTAVVGALSDGYQAFEMVRPTTVAALLGGLLLTLASVAVVACGGNIFHMALAYTLGPLCQVALLWVWARRQPFRPRLAWDMPAFWRMLREASPFLAILLVDMVGTRADVLLLVRLVGEASLGYYTAAMSLVDRVRVLSDGTASALLPAVAYLTAQAPAAAVPLLRKSAMWLLLVSLPLAIFCTALAPVIVGVIFGAQYAAAAPVLALGMWRVPLWCMMMLVMHCLYAVHRQNLALWSCIVMTVVHLAILFPLVHFFGLLGGPIALLVKNLAMFFWRLPVVNSYFPGMWPWGQMGRITAAAALMSVPLAFVPALGMHWLTFVIAPVSAAIYVASLVALRVEPVMGTIDHLGERFGRMRPVLAWATGARPGQD